MEPSAKKIKGKGIPYSFVALPKAVLHCEEFRRLSSSAKTLLLELASQYTGGNNGRLTPAWSVLQKTGWASNNTVLSAKKELLNCPFVVMTRKGHPPRTCEWIGFTWWKINWNKEMDIQPREFPYLNFLSIQSQSIDPNVGRTKHNV